MPNKRDVYIIYHINSGGVTVEKETPVKGRCVLYENKQSAIIPAHMTIHLNYSKIYIIEKED